MELPFSIQYLISNSHLELTYKYNILKVIPFGNYFLNHTFFGAIYSHVRPIHSGSVYQAHNAKHTDVDTKKMGTTFAPTDTRCKTWACVILMPLHRYAKSYFGRWRGDTNRSSTYWFSTSRIRLDIRRREVDTDSKFLGLRDVTRLIGNTNPTCKDLGPPYSPPYRGCDTHR